MSVYNEITSVCSSPELAVSTRHSDSEPPVEKSAGGFFAPNDDQRKGLV